MHPAYSVLITLKVFVYRNLVKALNWFTAVRSILDDPAYSGFFLRFSGASGPLPAPPPGPFHVPPCTTQNNATLCSGYYHDQEQTPTFVSPLNPAPGIPCYAPCDCGALPCGEYLFDHRNGSQLTNWLIENYILSDSALGSPAVSGLFIDDFWCSLHMNTTDECNDPVAGPSEIDPYSQTDMGLSNHSVSDITQGWLHNMERVQEAILSAKGYTWSLIPGQANANAQPVIVNATNCAATLRNATLAPEVYQSAPLIAGLSYNSTTSAFPWLSQQLAAFLLMRGPYAYIGWGEWGMWWCVSMPPVSARVLSVTCRFCTLGPILIATQADRSRATPERGVGCGSRCTPRAGVPRGERRGV